MTFTLKQTNTLIMTMVLALGSSYTLAGEGGHSHHGKTKVGYVSEESNFGKPGVASEVTQTIEVSMGDNMRFTPEKIQIRQGETIRFVVKNAGAATHEMVLGAADDIREHAEMMKKMPGMKHIDPSTASVESGKSGEIIWNFDLAGEFQFVCLIPGHSEAGMKGTITVLPKA